MNKKAFVNPFTIVLGYLIFLGLWFFALAEVINYWVQVAIQTNGLTGIEAFMLANMNLWIFILSLITVIAGTYITGGNE